MRGPSGQRSGSPKPKDAKSKAVSTKNISHVAVYPTFSYVLVVLG